MLTIYSYTYEGGIDLYFIELHIDYKVYLSMIVAPAISCMCTIVSIGLSFYTIKNTNYT